MKNRDNEMVDAELINKSVASGTEIFFLIKTNSLSLGPFDSRIFSAAFIKNLIHNFHEFIINNRTE